MLASCETLVKRNYSLLGWEYQDSCSDVEMSTTASGRLQEHTHTHVCSNLIGKFHMCLFFFSVETPSTHEIPVHDFSSANRLTPSLQEPGDSPKPCAVGEKTFQIDLKRQPVVVLVRLSPSLISSLRSPLSKSPNTENNDDSDSSWEPDTDDQSNSDSTIPHNDAPPKKSRKITKNEAPKHFTKDCGRREREKSSKSTMDENTKTLAESKSSDVQDPPRNREAEICLGMAVLARNQDQIWQKGKVIEIVRNGKRIETFK